MSIENRLDPVQLSRIWLSLSTSLSYNAKQRLMHYASPLDLFENFDSALLHIISEKAYKELLLLKQGGLDKIQEALLKRNISVSFLGDEQYPVLLSSISDPPDVLFYKGRLSAEELPSISIVGSRRETKYGRKQAEKIAYELAESGVCIVSGLAYGIDSAAHTGCVNAKGKTIAVLGSGINNIYPKDNEELANQIIELGGALLSELPPNADPLAFHFPARNRIVSGLAHALLLIEAREKSGTMITVNHALQQGREVFVLPGPVDVESSIIPNRLLREGARACTKAQDILLDMGWIEDSVQEKQLSLPVLELTSVQQKIYDALSQDTLGLEELIDKTGLSVSNIMAELGLLELQDIIEALPGKRYKISR